ncbi:MAG: RimK/LysX family protein [Pseudomonadota bacterium]
MRFCGLLAAGAAAISASGAAAEPELYDPNDKVPDTPFEVRGWLEHARLMPQGLLLDAKLDSGARTSSIDADILDPRFVKVDENGRSDDDDVEIDEGEELEIEFGEDAFVDMAEAPPPGETVVFRVTNENGNSRILRREVVRWVEIKRRGGGTIRRPVVHLGFCISGLWVEGEVNLADREGLNYPLLVGRNMLDSAAILIDSRETYTYKSYCEPPKD